MIFWLTIAYLRYGFTWKNIMVFRYLRYGFTSNGFSLPYAKVFQYLRRRTYMGCLFYYMIVWLPTHLSLFSFSFPPVLPWTKIQFLCCLSRRTLRVPMLWIVFWGWADIWAKLFIVFRNHSSWHCATSEEEVSLTLVIVLPMRAMSYFIPTSLTYSGTTKRIENALRFFCVIASHVSLLNWT